MTTQTQPPWVLTYLFDAHFEDGTVIRQTLEDKSWSDPLRSAYSDVLQAIEGGRKLKSFALWNDDHVYAVDLTDGHFEVDHLPFFVQPVSSNCFPAGGVYRLIYFRDHEQDIIASQTGPTELGEHRIAYRFGWEYEIAGKTWQQTMVII
jgi:hypothetical protein